MSAIVLPFTPPEPPAPGAAARCFQPRRKPTRCFPIAAMVRQWEVLRLLESKAYTVHELARAVHASRLLIARDLRVIERAGFPLYDDVDEDGARRWRLASKGVTPARRVA
jgi:hypothetical protein